MSPESRAPVMVSASWISQASLETTPAAIAEHPIPMVPAIAAVMSQRPNVLTTP